MQYLKPATMTIKRACDYSGLGKTTIYDKIKDGQLHVRKIGRRTLITTASLNALLELDGSDELEAA